MPVSITRSAKKVWQPYKRRMQPPLITVKRVGDSSTLKFKMRKGLVPLFVYEDGHRQRDGEGERCVFKYDGYNHWVIFLVVAPAAVRLEIDCYREVM